jgi:hypothetical protein
METAHASNARALKTKYFRCAFSTLEDEARRSTWEEDSTVASQIRDSSHRLICRIWQAICSFNSRDIWIFCEVWIVDFKELEGR